ncbi:MAG: MmcQ/YjbR family DNA-binding protein [Devosia sp.]|uniref:MmcQ/YjbR family DNA-binding protein n=1 Tax=Devosia sp. TaxID=1871048 RepID=UPI002615BAC5|nr:MmcQ/YjbR family DNA-binding protein [Devosia sp.]MDB5537135.1 MmcQ/YjbR family DNA-binding protein [Devosia sp.]MDB5585589.1 MmcQ/YjbR family DNA-binding protein [Devosia sp.]
MSAPIFTRAGFEPFVLAQPAATLVHQWRDDSVAKVGGKIFALLDNDPGEVWLKVSELAFDMLTELPGIRPAPYFARASWVAIGLEAPLREDEVRAYIVEAHRLIATRLTRRIRAELALDGLIAAGPRRS